MRDDASAYLVGTSLGIFAIGWFLFVSGAPFPVVSVIWVYGLIFSVLSSL